MFGSDVDNKIMQAAIATPDKEICGFIINGEFVQTENKHKNPAEHFNAGDVPDGAQAIVHSHPGGPFYPSESDMAQQQATALPWGIACFHDLGKEVFWFGDGAPKAPLVGRGFRHGVTDCYSLIEDFHSIRHNITLKSYPREWEWWDKGQNFYDECFEKTGFVEVSKSQIQPGDVFLAQIRSSVANHGGIYIGNGLILHHTCGRSGYDPTRLSVVEPAARWMAYLTRVLRYTKQEFYRSPGQGVAF